MTTVPSAAPQVGSYGPALAGYLRETAIKFSDLREFPKMLQGEVIDLNDAHKNGNIKIRIHNINSKSDSENSFIYANMLHPIGGGPGYGFFSLPPVGSQVYLAFPNGNMNNPIIMGSWYPLKFTGGVSAATPEENLKAAYQAVPEQVTINNAKENIANNNYLSANAQEQEAIIQVLTDENGGNIPEQYQYTTLLDNFASNTEPLTYNQAYAISTISTTPDLVDTNTQNILAADTTTQRYIAQSALDSSGDRSNFDAGVSSTTSTSVDAPFANKINVTSDTAAGKLSTGIADSFQKLAGDKLSDFIKGKGAELISSKLEKYDEQFKTLSAQMMSLFSKVKALCDLLITKGYVKNAQAVAMNTALISFSNTMIQISSVMQGGISGLAQTVLGNAAKMVTDGAFKMFSGQLGELSAKFDGLSADFKGSILARDTLASNAIYTMNEMAKTVSEFSEIAKATLDAAGAASDFIDPGSSSRINSLLTGALNQAGEPGRVMEGMLNNLDPRVAGYFKSAINRIASPENTADLQTFYTYNDRGKILDYAQNSEDKVTIAQAGTEGVLEPERAFYLIEKGTPEEITAAADEIRKINRS